MKEIYEGNLPPISHDLDHGFLIFSNNLKIR